MMIFVLFFSLMMFNSPFNVDGADIIGENYLGPSWSTTFGKNIKGTPSLVDLDRDGVIEVSAICRWRLNKPTLEEQTEETQMKINNLLTK